MNTSAVQIAEAAAPRAVAWCPQWCTNGPHEDAYLRARRDGEATVVHEVYFLRQDTAEVVVEQLVTVSSAHETNPMPPSLYVRVEEETTSPETAARLADALIAAARLMAQVAAPGLRSAQSATSPG